MNEEWKFQKIHIRLFSLNEVYLIPYPPCFNAKDSETYDSNQSEEQCMQWHYDPGCMYRCTGIENWNHINLQLTGMMGWYYSGTTYYSGQQRCVKLYFLLIGWCQCILYLIICHYLQIFYRAGVELQHNWWLIQRTDRPVIVNYYHKF